MRLDYSEKMGAVRESAERKPLQKNRPRKEPIGIFALLLLLVLLVFTFGAGVLTGWFLFKGGKDAPAASAPVPPVTEQLPSQGLPGAVPQETPLTFYNTLPSGGQAVIGSGLNPKIGPATPTQPAPEPVAAPAAKPAGSKEGGETRYLVQIASYRDKKEAEAAQAKLSGKGVAAYLVESKVPDKGVWYRLRVGRHLSREEAGQLAGKVGGGATVLPD